MTAAVLRARSLTKAFDGGGQSAAGRSGRAQEIVLHHVDLDVSAGDLVAVEGRKGSGKTTLLRCLAGTYRPDAGQLLWDRDRTQTDLARIDTRLLAWIRLRFVSAFDGPLAAPPRQAVRNAVARASRLDLTAAQDALDRAGCGALSDLDMGRLRPAAATQVALVSALAKDATLVLLDEPLVDRDGRPPEWAVEWIDERCAAGAAVVATTSAASGLAHATTTHTVIGGQLL